MAKRIKTGGRSQGTPNLLTKELRERINDFLNENWPQIEKDFMTLEPDKRVILFEKLLQFTLPRLQTIQTPDIKNNEIPIIVFKDFNDKSKSKKQNPKTWPKE